MKDPNIEINAIYELWLAVVLDALESLAFRSKTAKEFLLDPENQFFDIVIERLGHDPARARGRIKEIIREKHDG